MSDIHHVLPSTTNDIDNSISTPNIFNSPFTLSQNAPCNIYNRLNSNQSLSPVSLISPTYPLRSLSAQRQQRNNNMKLDQNESNNAIQSPVVDCIMDTQSSMFRRPTPRLSSRAFTSHSVMNNNDITQQKDSIASIWRSPRLDLHRFIASPSFTAPNRFIYNNREDSHNHNNMSNNNMNNNTTQQSNVYQSQTRSSGITPTNDPRNNITFQLQALYALQSILLDNNTSSTTQIDKSDQLRSVLQNLHDSGVDLSLVRNSITAILQPPESNKPSDKQHEHIQYHIDNVLNSVKQTTKQLSDMVQTNGNNQQQQSIDMQPYYDVDSNNNENTTISDMQIDSSYSIQRQDKLQRLQASLQAASKAIDPLPAVQTPILSNVRTATYQRTKSTASDSKSDDQSQNNNNTAHNTVYPAINQHYTTTSTTTDSSTAPMTQSVTSSDHEHDMDDSDSESSHDGALMLGIDGKPIGSSCHQCKTRRTDNDLYFCSTTHLKKGRTKLLKTERLCRKKYCGRCLVKFYGQVPPAHTGPNPLNTWSCPGCLGICTCAACKRQRNKQIIKQQKLQAKLDAKIAAKQAKQNNKLNKQSLKLQSQQNNKHNTTNKSTKSNKHTDNHNINKPNNDNQSMYLSPNSPQINNNNMPINKTDYSTDISIQWPVNTQPQNTTSAPLQSNQSYNMVNNYMTPQTPYNMLNQSVLLQQSSPFTLQPHVSMLLNQQSPASQSSYRPLQYIPGQSPLIGVHTQSPFITQYAFSPHQSYHTIDNNQMLLQNIFSPMMQNRSLTTINNQRTLNMFDSIQSPEYVNRILINGNDDSSLHVTNNNNNNT